MQQAGSLRVLAILLTTVPRPQNNMSFLSEICQRPHCMDE